MGGCNAFPAIYQAGIGVYMWLQTVSDCVQYMCIWKLHVIQIDKAQTTFIIQGN